MERFIGVERADALLAEALPAYEAEPRPIEACAGRILRQPVVADRPQPPYDRVTMDGIAFRYEEWRGGRREFALGGTQAAGVAPLTLVEPGVCLEVMTGAVLPEGADCIARVEDVEISNGFAVIRDGAVLAARQFVHARGSDCSAGAVLLEPGVRLTAPRIAICAAMGLARLDVGKTLRIAVVSTGDELVDLSEAAAPHQVRRSNSYAIAGALQRRLQGDGACFHIPDDAGETERILREILEQFDVLVLSGGVSMGKFDYVPQALERLSVEGIFHKVTQRPGKPMWFGVGREGQAVFALPGNPVSAIVCLTRYVIPHLERASGLTEPHRERAALARSIDFSPDLTYFVPVQLSSDGEGPLRAAPQPTNTSGDFVALGATDGIMELKRGQDGYPQGYASEVYRWAE